MIDTDHKPQIDDRAFALLSERFAQSDAEIRERMAPAIGQGLDKDKTYEHIVAFLLEVARKRAEMTFLTVQDPNFDSGSKPLTWHGELAQRIGARLGGDVYSTLSPLGLDEVRMRESGAKVIVAFLRRLHELLSTPASGGNH